MVHFWGFKIFEFQYFWGVFQKNEFWFEDFVDILGRSSQTLTILEGLFLYILGSFLKVNVQNRNILGVAKISNIFFGMPDIPDIILVNSRCWVQPYVASQFENTPMGLNHIPLSLRAMGR